MTRRTLFLLILLLSAQATHAWELQHYAGFGMGQGFYSKDAESVERDLGRDGWNADVTMKDSSTVWKAYWGVYFTPFLGLQLGYANLGNTDISTSAGVSEERAEEFLRDMTDAEPDLGKGFQVSVTGRFPVSESIIIHDWLGVFVWENESTATLAGREFKETSQGTNFVLGAAVEYRLNYELGARIEFERFNQKGDAVNVLGAGVAYYF